jgi:penicillin-binding protein 1A
VEDSSGKVLQEASPALACFECDRVSDPTATAGGAGTRAGFTTAALTTAAHTASLDVGPHDGKTLIPAKDLAPQIIRPQVAYLLADMMKDVIRRGTGVRARTLNRDDIAAKTGTTNDAHDAWFNGFNGDIETTVWIGFDQDRSLGEGEQGGRTAVPAWTYFMHEALAGAPRHGVPVPDGIVTARISPETGLLASSDDPNGIMEKFIEGNLPKSESYEGPNNSNPMNDGDKPLF